MRTAMQRAIHWVLLVLLLAGCSAISTDDQVPASTPAATPTEVPTASPPTAVPEEGYGEAQYAVEQAVSHLQERLNVKSGAILVQDVKETEFSDASLGVPEPGKMYAQVVTPGYVIRLDVNGQTYVYHSDGEQVVPVPQESAEATPTPGSRPVPPLSGDLNFHRVEIAEANLSLEIPSGWLRLDPEWAWTPEEGSDLLVGVRWADLQPPQEAEAALLPVQAQILDSQPLALSWGSGRQFILEVYGEAAQGQGQAKVQSFETHTLIVLNLESGRRAFDLYAAAPNADALAALQSVLQHALETSALSAAEPTSTGETPAGWQTFADEEYGFQLSVPAEWTWKELPATGDGMPDDWPVVRIVHFYPQAWDAQINRSGPPDPTAKVVVSPVQLEVLIGGEAELRRVYVEPAATETIEVNGLQVTVEKEVFEPMSINHYVFTSPADESVHVILSDLLSGFPERVEGNEEMAALVEQIVGTVRFGP